MMTTTGAVTVPNYTDSRAGKQGEFHHILGAVVVEIESRKKFHLRHIQARKDGAFIDLNQAYFPDGEIQPTDATIVILGDAHYRFADPQVVEGTFGGAGSSSAGSGGWCGTTCWTPTRYRRTTRRIR
jgi:hypothetical protein